MMTNFLSSPSIFFDRSQHSKKMLGKNPTLHSNTGTRALVVRANFYNPSMDVAVAASGTCEFTAGGSVHCVPGLDILPVKTSVLDWHNTMMLCVVLLLFFQFAIAMIKLSQMGAARYFGFRRSGAAISPVRKVFSNVGRENVGERIYIFCFL